MKLWQEAMIALARSERVTNLVQSRQAFRGLARRFVGGESATDALETARRLQSEGIASSLDFLGEYVEDPVIIERTIDQLGQVVGQLSTANMDLHLSVDPTQLGLLTDEATCTANARRLAEMVAKAIPGDKPRPGRDALTHSIEHQESYNSK